VKCELIGAVWYSRLIQDRRYYTPNRR